MTWRSLAVGAAACTLLAASGCHDGGRSEAGGAETGRRVLARVAGSPILPAELGQDPEAGPAERRRALERVIARRLAAREARRRGLEEEASVEEALSELRREARAREEALLRDALFERMREELELSEAELRAHYEERRGRYLRRELELRAWRFASEEEARRALERLAAGEALAAPEPERYGPAPVRALPPEIARAALELEEPGARAVRATADGAVLVELREDERKAAPLEAVRGRVEASLRTLRAQAAWTGLLEELRAAADVEVDRAALARLGRGESEGERTLEAR